MNIYAGLKRIFSVMLFALSAPWTVHVEAAFAQPPISPFSNLWVFTSQHQPDGKLLLAGSARYARPDQHLNGSFAIGRLNADGTVDQSFANGSLAYLPIWGAFEGIDAIVLQPDGRIVISGYANDPADPACRDLPCDPFRAVIRLNTDGSVDPTFNAGEPLVLQLPAPVTTSEERDVGDTEIDLIADGSFLVFEVGYFSLHRTLAHIKADGTVDLEYPRVVSTVRPIDFVTVIEYYAPGIDHYFMTADRAESFALDYNDPGWQRTGQAFHARLPGVADGNQRLPVCRLYSKPLNLQTHFYSANAVECEALIEEPAAWTLESRSAFFIDVPDAVTGSCPPGQAPIYRLWNHRVDTNHRFTTDVEIRNRLVASGYIAEGYGPSAVMMCAAP